MPPPQHNIQVPSYDNNLVVFHPTYFVFLLTAATIIKKELKVIVWFYVYNLVFFGSYLLYIKTTLPYNKSLFILVC